jgi:cytochrome d ubiquinol oxidase subunit II
MYEQRHDRRWRRAWGRAFVAGSLAAPFTLGVFVGNWLFGVEGVASLASLTVGLAVVALTVVDGAAFLGLKTRGDLRRETSAVGHVAQGAYLLLAVGAVALGSASAGHVALAAAETLALLGATVGLAALHVVAGRRGRRYLAFAAVVAQVYGLVALVAIQLYPLVDPVTGRTAAAAVVSTLPLNLTTIGAAVLLPLVATYFVVLYTAFAGPVGGSEADGGPDADAEA